MSQAAPRIEPSAAPPSAADRTRATVTGLLSLGAVLAAGVLVAALHATARVYYDSLRVPQGYGMEFLLPAEWTHFGLFVVFGLAVQVMLAYALMATGLPGALRSAARALARRPRLVAGVCALAVTAACLAISTQVMGDGTLTDDEHVYRFIAQTLRAGSLTALSPGTDLEFFFEQFVVTTDTVRYGKYPIGFPLLLAAGQAIGAERAVVPVLTGLLVLLTGWAGGKAFSPGVAVVGLVLLVFSPQVLLTGGASFFSQPASAVCLMGALGCLFELAGGSRTPLPWALGAGAFLGFGVLTRPLPGVLFAATAVLALALGPRMGWRRRPGPAEWAAFLLPVALGPLTLLLVNYQQSGHPFVTGYHTLHGAEWGPTLLFHGTLARWAMSLVTHLVRLNFWLFGWPVSLVFVAFARRTPATLLLWGMVGAEVAYRLIAPKGGVGHVGPLYVFEIVPVLCLLSADGVARIVERAPGWTLPEGLRRLLRPDAVAAAIMAGVFVSVSLFLPFKLADVGRAAYGQQTVFRELRRKGVHRAIVFHRAIVPPWLGLSWAYFPPPNPPRLDGDVMFALLQTDPPTLEKNLEFWKRRFPDREAWFFGWDVRTGPFLVPLATYVESARMDAPGASPVTGHTPGP